MKHKKYNLLYLAFVLCIPLLFFVVTRSILSNEFDNNCSSKLEQFESADDAETAIKNLDSAIFYLENKKLVSGYTSVWSYSKDEDLKIFYDNLKLKQSYFHSLNGDQLKFYFATRKVHNLSFVPSIRYIPDGISVYPHNYIYGLWLIVSLILFIYAVITVICFFDMNETR